MNTLSIRPGTAGDTPVIHRLLTELEETLGMEGAVKRQSGDILKFGFSDKPLFETLIAWNGDQAVGLAVYFSEFSTWKGSPGVYVQDLYVSDRVRGSGLGRQLMESLIERSRRWGATYCKLSVYGQNEAAMAFYEHIGFQVSANETVLKIDYR